MWLARSEHVIRLSGSGSVPKFNFIPKTPIIHHKILIHLLSYVSIAQCSNVNIMSLFNSLINLQRYLTENISFSHFVLTTIASKGSVYLFTVQSRDTVFPILIMKPLTIDWLGIWFTLLSRNMCCSLCIWHRYIHNKLTQITISSR